MPVLLLLGIILSFFLGQPQGMRELCAAPLEHPPVLDEQPSKRERLDALEARNRLQEAIWLAKDLGELQKAATLQARLEAAFAPGQCVKVGRARGGGSLAFLLRCWGVNGEAITALFKPDRCRLCSPRSWLWGNSTIADARREVAAYEIDQLFDLNLVPYTSFYRFEGIKGSLQAYIEGMVTAPNFSQQDATSCCIANQMGVFYQKQPVDNWLRLLILDFITHNSDRHGGNVLFWELEGRAIAIDHGLTFSQKGFVKQLTLSPTCRFNFKANVRRYAGFYEFKAPLQASLLPARVRARLFLYTPAQVEHKLKALLSKAHIEQLLQSLQQLQDCLRREEA